MCTAEPNSAAPGQHLLELDDPSTIIVCSILWMSSLVELEQYFSGARWP